MNPTQYDREQIKRLRTMKDGGNAIFNTNALDYAYYGDEARKNIALQSIADMNESRDARLAENKKQFNTVMSMAGKKREDADEMDDIAEGFGWADMILGGIQGVSAYNKERKKADQTDEMTAIIRDMIRS